MDKNGAYSSLRSETKILDRMRRLCSKREYCSSDIRAKVLAALPQEDGAENYADEIMASLAADKYIDDLRYATAFARDKSSLSGWGEAKIRFALSAKKIGRETISAALEEIDSVKAAERLEKLLLVKLRSLAGGQSHGNASCEACDAGRNMEVRRKLLRFALSRGYRFDEAEPVISRLLSK